MSDETLGMIDTQRLARASAPLTSQFCWAGAILIHYPQNSQDRLARFAGICGIQSSNIRRQKCSLDMFGRWTSREHRGSSPCADSVEKRSKKTICFNILPEKSRACLSML